MENESGTDENATRRRLLAACGAGVVSGTAGCGLVDRGDDEGVPATVPEQLPLAVTNRLTAAAFERSSLAETVSKDAIPLRVAVSVVESDTLEETQLFGRETTIAVDENRRWNNALDVDRAVDQYVLKGTVAPDRGPYSEDILRFAPDEIPSAVGTELDIVLGLFPDIPSDKAFFLRTEPDRSGGD